MWGAKTVIGDVTQAAYLGPWCGSSPWKRRASFDIDKIAAAFSGVEFKGAPEGYVRIHGEPSFVEQDSRRPRKAQRPVRSHV